MINLKQNKGITLVTLILAIIIMLIISSVILYNANTGMSTRALNDMYKDITIIKDRVDIYYAQYGTLPIVKTLYTNVENIKNININDNENYYVVDVEALDNITLTYGKDYKEYKQVPSNEKTDLYVINEQSHTVYYIDGITLDNISYYTIPNEYTKVKIPEVNRLKLNRLNNNIATLEIYAINKNVGIQRINLYKGNDIYKTYEYTDLAKEQKQEIIDVELVFYEESNFHMQIIDTNGNSTTSETITLINEDIISTKEDLYALAEVVNSGNTLEGKIIKQINDIDLEGSQDNQWTPIGNITSNFKGTFDGNNHNILGLYSDRGDIRYLGLFGINNGTIKNLNIVNCYLNSTWKHTGDSGYIGAISGANDGKIQNCSVSGNISMRDNNAWLISAGGISGSCLSSNTDNLAYIENCYNTANITIDSNNNCIVKAGGIAANLRNCKIINCYNEGNITATAAVNESLFKGGIAGENDSGITSVLISNCYNVGEINQGGIVGGVLSHLNSDDININNCYYINTYTVTNDDGSIPLTKEQMQTATFANILNKNEEYKSDMLWTSQYQSKNEYMWIYKDNYPTLKGIS